MEWIPINLPFYLYNDNDNDSFTSRGLAKPGVQIRTADGNEYLIGDINTQGGVCDCCTEVKSYTVVVAYRVVWPAESTTR